MSSNKILRTTQRGTTAEGVWRKWSGPFVLCVSYWGLKILDLMRSEILGVRASKPTLVVVLVLVALSYGGSLLQVCLANCRIFFLPRLRPTCFPACLSLCLPLVSFSKICTQVVSQLALSLFAGFVLHLVSLLGRVSWIFLPAARPACLSACLPVCLVNCCNNFSYRQCARLVFHLLWAIVR